MSEMIIIECDHEDGECSERFEGFALNATDKFKQNHLQEEGWLAQDDKHYCPKHKAEHELEGEML